MFNMDHQRYGQYGHRFLVYFEEYEECYIPIICLSLSKHKKQNINEWAKQTNTFSGGAIAITISVCTVCALSAKLPLAVMNFEN